MDYIIGMNIAIALFSKVQLTCKPISFHNPIYMKMDRILRYIGNLSKEEFKIADGDGNFLENHYLVVVNHNGIWFPIIDHFCGIGDSILDCSSEDCDSWRLFPDFNSALDCAKKFNHALAIRELDSTAYWKANETNTHN